MAHRLVVVLSIVACSALLLPMSTAGGATSPPSAPACPVFPSDNVWNADISGLPVNSRSAQWMASASAATTHLHPDFGPSGTTMPYGIPWITVDSTHPLTSPTFQYGAESDPGPYPFGPDTPIEGGSASTGDRHAIMVNRDSCELFELYDARYSSSGSTAGSGATWDLRSNALRPAGWTSADAAGLPIFPGLLRQDEVAAGSVTHAIRFTLASTDQSYVWPARHQAGSRSDPSLPPMGARFRLKAGFDIGGFRADTQVVLRAMQHYGLILADNGSNWYFQGAAENGWDPAFLDELKSVPASAFEAVDESALMVSTDSAAVVGGAHPAPAPQAPGGYRLVASDGGVFCFGDAAFDGSTGGLRLVAPIAGAEGDPAGYRLLARDGGVFTFGQSRFLGSAAGMWPGTDAVAIVAPDAGGYWVVGAGGQIAAFGDAPGIPSTSLPSPAVAAVRSTTGMWIVSRDGTVTSVGGAPQLASAVPPGLRAPIVGAAATPSGDGLWLVGGDGGVFTAGTAAFHGSTGAMTLNQPVVSIASTPTGRGYWLIAQDGGVFSFGDAAFHGSTGGIRLNRPVMTVAGAS